jgi:hypothetical protein
VSENNKIKIGGEIKKRRKNLLANVIKQRYV